MMGMFAHAADADTLNSRASTPTVAYTVTPQNAMDPIEQNASFFRSIKSSFSGSLSSLSSLWPLSYDADSQSSLNSSANNPEGTTPITKKVHTINRLLGAEQGKALIPDIDTKDNRDYLKQNPEVYPAILTAFGAYGDQEAQPVNDNLRKLGFVREILEENLMLYMNADTKKAWFAISGTDSLGDMFTSMGIVGNMTSSEIHDAMTIFIGHCCIPQWMSDHWLAQYASYAWGSLSSYFEFNMHKLTSLAYIMFGYSVLPRDFGTYALQLQGMIACSTIATGVVFYYNVLPILMKKWRYQGQIRHLLARIRTRRKELEDMGYEIMLSGH
ncbi:MAG: hypothetical protein Q8K36_06795, partial [Alphaproteobacteria bacterium]|nr:hypothetical protein [Alphaproteobacteria bacterium]